jgi:MIP family channel proteins
MGGRDASTEPEGLRQLVAPYVAEFLGTFALVFAGPGSAAVNAASQGAVGQVGIGLSFGLVVMAMVFALGHVSGSHINPAVSLSFRLRGLITNERFAGYVVVQLAGAVVAGLAIVAIVGTPAADASASVPTIGGTDAAFWSEIILTFFLVLVILEVATDARAYGAMAAVAIGGFVAVAATGWGPVAGASMNPARSFGPAVATGIWDDQWVYWLGPAAGAALAVLVFQVLREDAGNELMEELADGD